MSINPGADERHRFTERRLEDGEEVYVLGIVDRDPATVPTGSDARLVVTGENQGLTDRLFGDPFVVSDTGVEEATRRQLKSALVALGFGSGFVAIPFVVAVLMILFG